MPYGVAIILHGLVLVAVLSLEVKVIPAPVTVPLFKVIVTGVGFA
jgi:hypothetical protein